MTVSLLKVVYTFPLFYRFNLIFYQCHITENFNFSASYIHNMGAINIFVKTFFLSLIG